MLLSSSLFSSACALLTLSLNSRALGVEDFGTLALIQSYTALIAGWMTFECWQPTVRLGLRVPRRLGLILSIGIIIDLAASCGAGVLAILGAIYLAPVFGISDRNVVLVLIYSLSLFAGVSGTPKGYFRLRQNFNVLAANQAALAAALAVASAFLWSQGSGLLVYAIVFSAIGAFYNLSILARMLLCLKREGIVLHNPFATYGSKRLFRIFLSAASGSAIVSTLVSTRRQLAFLVVGWSGGEASTGLFAIATRLVSAAGRVTQLVNQVLFSEVLTAAARMTPSTWKRLIWRATWASAGIACLMILAAHIASEAIVRLVAGSGFDAAAPIFEILFAAECLALASLHLNPVIQRKYGTGPLVRVDLATTAVYLILIYFLSIRFGLLGTSVAILSGAVINYILMLTWARRVFHST